MTPTARSLAHCRKNNWPVANVEKWLPMVKKRQDMFGFADLVVLLPGAILAVQATSGSNHAARVSKVKANENAVSWARAGGCIAVWSWSKTGPRGQRKLWTLRTEEVVL